MGHKDRREVQEFTLDEAAEKLGIRRESVYKRVQRGTLAHIKGSDGRVYVYLDTDEGTSKDGEDSKSDVSTRDFGRFDLTNLSTFLTVFVSLGSLTYVLGLLVLWVPLARAYTHDFVTAWHAVSVVPRGVIAGLGVKQLVALPLLIIIVLAAITFAFDRLFFWLLERRASRGLNLSREGEITPHPLEITPHLLLTLMATSVPILFYVGWLILFRFPGAYLIGVAMVILASTVLYTVILMLDIFLAIPNVRGKGTDPNLLIDLLLSLGITYVVWRLFFKGIGLSLQNLSSVTVSSMVDAFVVIAAAVSAYAAAQFMVMGIRYYRQARERFSGRVLSVLIIGCAFLTAFLLTIVNHQPPLPMVKIDGIVNVEGRLLAHSNGFWYVYVREGEQEVELIAIPDNEVETARVLPDAK